VEIAGHQQAEQFFWKKSYGLLRKSSDFFYAMRQKFSEAGARRFPLRNHRFSILTYYSSFIFLQSWP
jgi:hypothetical protein